MIIKQIDRGTKGYFIARENNKEAGRMVYFWDEENRMIVDHTIVKPEFEGQGVGKKLLFALVEFVRQQDIKVIPVCPFAKAMFKRMPEIRDVLSE